MAFLKTSFTMRGNLTRDAIVRPAGKLFAVNMGVAVQERTYDAASKTWKNADPTYYNLVKFVQKADYFTENAKKGAPILATGEIRQNVWEDPKTKEKKTTYDFVADQLEFLIKPAKAETPAPAATAPEDNPDIPF